MSTVCPVLAKFRPAGLYSFVSTAANHGTTFVLIIAAATPSSHGRDRRVMYLETGTSSCAVHATSLNPRLWSLREGRVPSD
jgi:hypothetical protein